MRELPMDIIKEILYWLRVKPLMRFKCISKSWCYLISCDTHFAKMHLKRACNQNQHSNIVLLPYFIVITEFTIELTLLLADCRLLEKVKLTFDMDNPRRGVGPRVGGSCDGLVWLELGKHDILWNPSINVYKELPEHKRRESTFGFTGLGYDSTVDDYKMVIGYVNSCTIGNDEIGAVELYTTKTNTWRTIELEEAYFTKSCFIWNYNATYLNGALHWLEQYYFGSTSRDAILTWDLVGEKFRHIPLSPMIDKIFKGNSTCTLDALGDNLCVVNTVILQVVSYNTELWILKEYNVPASWTRILNIPWTSRINYIGKVLPLSISKLDEEVLVAIGVEGHGVIRVYNIKERSTMETSARYSYAATYIESLVFTQWLAHEKIKVTGSS